MGKRRQRRRGGGRGRRSAGQPKSRYFEWYHGSTTPGTVSIVQRNHIEIQFDRAFKLVAVHYELSSSGGPTFVNVRGYGPIGQTGAVSETGVFIVGGLPRKGTLRIAAPWFPKDTPGNATVCTVDNICDKATADKTRLFIVLRMEVILSPEEVTAACPKLLASVSADSWNERAGASSECIGVGARRTAGQSKEPDSAHMEETAGYILA